MIRLRLNESNYINFYLTENTLNNLAYPNQLNARIIAMFNSRSMIWKRYSSVSTIQKKKNDKSIAGIFLDAL